jgi:AraC-like DNA-binding protein
MGYALLASQTMRKAIALSQRYLALTYAFCEIEYFEDNESFYLKFSPPSLNELGLLVLIRDLWAAAVIQKELFSGNEIPYSLHLQCDFPAEYKDIGIEALEKTLGGKIVFNADYNAFKGLIAELDRPLAKANEMTARLCEEQCRELLTRKQDWSNISEQVRDILLNEGLASSMGCVAKRMARTERTLHRQLKEEATTWRKVRDDVRIGLAEELLQQPLLLDEIAERLGYSDATNFSHSFKRCKGCSPSQYRRDSKKSLSLPRRLSIIKDY